MSDKVSRRRLFGLPTSVAAPDEPGAEPANGADAAPPGAASFSLDGFYAEREAKTRAAGSSAAAAFPRVELRAGLPEVETTRVGTPELAPRRVPRERTPVPVQPFSGRLRVMPEHCLAWQRTFCAACSEHCPSPGAIVANQGRPEVVEAACTKCGVCIQVCPAPVNAFEVLPGNVGESSV
jgi:ferredoxin